MTATLPGAGVVEGTERAVIGVVLQYAAPLKQIREALNVEHFGNPFSRAVYAAALAVLDATGDVEPLLVGDELDRRGELAKLGGLPGLLDFVHQENPATGANIEHLAKIIIRESKRRGVREIKEAFSQLETSSDFTDDDLALTIERARLILDQGPTPRRTADEIRAADELNLLRARESARRQLRAEQVGVHGAKPSAVLLSDLLLQPDEPVRERIAGLMPMECRILFSAQYKAGKSTTIDNLLRSLVDGDDFLDHFKVNSTVRRLALIDAELSPRMLRSWLRDQAIQRTDAIATYSLRGRVSAFDILDAAVRREWADELRALGTEFVILDCLRPVLDALGLNEDKEAGRFFVAFDQLLNEAGVSDGLIVHHMGHSGERSRGDSRLRDWPDVEWKLVREKGDVDNPAATRYFSAFGRDVDVPEGELRLNTLDRHLVLVGGNRNEAASRAVIPAIVELLTDQPGLSGRQIETALEDVGHRNALRAALKQLVADGQIQIEAGPKRAKLHFLKGAVCASAPMFADD